MSAGCLYLQVKAPWIKHFVYVGSEGLCYILPGFVSCFINDRLSKDNSVCVSDQFNSYTKSVSGK